MKARRQSPLIHEQPLLALDEVGYFAIIRTILAELSGETTTQFYKDHTHHEWLFAVFGLLGTSVLGGMCWPSAFSWVVDLSFSDVSTLFGENTDVCGPILMHRNGQPYPIFWHPIVTFVLMLLVTARMRRHPSRTARLFPIPTGAALGPMKPGTRVEFSVVQTRYRLKLLQAYLTSLCVQVGLKTNASLDDFLGTGRFLLVFVYDMDVLYATLGDLTAGAPPFDQLSKRVLDDLRGYAKNG